MYEISDADARTYIDETAGYEPMRCALIQFTRLEYFSIRQQEDFPLDEDRDNGIAFIEAVVSKWMVDNGVDKFKGLYAWSRVSPDE